MLKSREPFHRALQTAEKRPLHGRAALLLASCAVLSTRRQHLQQQEGGALKMERLPGGQSASVSGAAGAKALGVLARDFAEQGLFGPAAKAA